MSSAYRNVEDILETLTDTIKEKHNDILSEIESDLEELDQYRNLFDDEYDARDARDYRDEMADIFDDTYDAQQAKDFVDALSYHGIDDESDFEEMLEELERYRALGTPEDIENLGRVDELKEQIEALEAQVQRGIELEDQRIKAIGVLGGIDKTQAEIDQRAAEEGAYEAGLTDAMILSTPKVQVQEVDIDLTQPDESGE